MRWTLLQHAQNDCTIHPQIEHRKRAHGDQHSVRALECGVCKRRFRTKQQMERHAAVHSGRKPHECSECPKTFSRKDKLKEHLRYT